MLKVVIDHHAERMLSYPCIDACFKLEDGKYGYRYHWGYRYGMLREGDIIYRKKGEWEYEGADLVG